MFSPRRFLLLLLPLFLCLSLGGCVRYDVGVQFPEQHWGQIRQHIQLGQQLTTLSQTEADRWLDSLSARAKSLGGQIQRRSGDELLLTIPFGSGRELTEKFNQFFNPPAPKGAKPAASQLDLLQLEARLDLQQRNWLLADQNRLRLTADLRALGVLSEQGKILLSPGSLLDLNFGLQTALWTRNLTPAPGEETPVLTRRTEWRLQPGEINTLEAVFWTPSYLGLGTLGIAALCFGGFYLKYRRWPGTKPAL
ncbi:MAG: DUF3153 domain-containing protein [Cyanobacteria bacterium RI_101]|nr:DUF3153 domain-containing protein [Cyanobacteria bacterium RI_101]